MCLNTMAFSVRPPIGEVVASPLGRNWCSLSSAIAAVAGSFFSEKYSDTPFAVTDRVAEREACGLAGLLQLAVDVEHAGMVFRYLVIADLLQRRFAVDQRA